LPKNFFQRSATLIKLLKTSNSLFTVAGLTSFKRLALYSSISSAVISDSFLFPKTFSNFRKCCSDFLQVLFCLISLMCSTYLGISSDSVGISASSISHCPSFTCCSLFLSHSLAIVFVTGPSSPGTP